MASTRYPCATAYAFPTENDINGGIVRWGRIPQETTLKSLLSYGGRRRSFVDGFAPPAVGFNVSNAHPCTGAALVNGYFIAMHSGNWECRFPYAVNYCYLRVVTASGKATEVGIEVYDSAQMPVGSNATPLWIVTVAAGLVSAVSEQRSRGLTVTGVITGFGPGIAEYGSGNWSFATIEGGYRITFQTPFYRTPMVLTLEGGGNVIAVTPTYLEIGSAAALIPFLVMD